jgi:hypothetical protein
VRELLILVPYDRPVRRDKRRRNISLVEECAQLGGGQRLGEDPVCSFLDVPVVFLLQQEGEKEVSWG